MAMPIQDQIGFMELDILTRPNKYNKDKPIFLLVSMAGVWHTNLCKSLGLCEMASHM